MSSAEVPSGVISIQDAPVLDVAGAVVQPLVQSEEDHLPSLLRGTLGPGVIVPLHAHADPETFVVLSGGAEVLVIGADGEAKWTPMRDGDIAHVPSGARHAWRNPTAEPTTFLVITTAALGRFFYEVGSPITSETEAEWPPSPHTAVRMAQVATQHGYWMGSPDDNAAIGIMLGP